MSIWAGVYKGKTLFKQCEAYNVLKGLMYEYCVDSELKCFSKSYSLSLSL